MWGRNDESLAGGLDEAGLVGELAVGDVDRRCADARANRSSNRRAITGGTGRSAGGRGTVAVVLGPTSRYTVTLTR